MQSSLPGTPHDEHPFQIVAATNRKKHVFVEKPLAFTRADAGTALLSAQKNNVVLAVGYNRRFLPAAQKLKAEIAKGSVRGISCAWKAISPTVRG